jgi:hypothetical protein
VSRSVPPICICVRATLDWQDEAAVEARLIDAFRPKVHAWNATFTLPYHLVRHRLKTLAQSNLARVDGAACVPLDAIPPDALVIPVDDDDWLAPDLATRLRERRDPAARGYLWNRDVLEIRKPLRRRFWYWLWSWKASTCNTNNYAFPYQPELDSLVRSHLKAGAHFDAQRERIVRLPETLAIQNRNLSSRTALAWRRPSITRQELITKFRRYQQLYRSTTLPASLAWARPYVDGMAELMDDIRIRGH